MKAVEKVYNEYSIASRRDRVPVVVKEIMGFLDKNTPVTGCDCVFDIKVVLSELISNAVIHGNHEDSSKPVDISVAFDGESLQFLIVDRGVEFTPDDKEDEKLLCEGNRGISICHVLCKRLHYAFIDGLGNSARAVFILKENKGGR